MPAEITGVMVGDLLIYLFGEGNFPFVDKFSNKLGRMKNFKFTAEIRIFVLESIIAMGRSGHYPGNPSFLKVADISFCECFKEIFVSGFSNTFTATLFHSTENSEIHACFFQNAYGGFSDPLDTRIVSGYTTGKIKHIHAFSELFYVKVLRPIRPVFFRFTEWVPGSRYIFHRYPQAVRDTTHAEFNDCSTHCSHDINDCDPAWTPVHTRFTGSTHP